MRNQQVLVDGKRARWAHSAEIVCQIAADSEYDRGRGVEERGRGVNMAAVVVPSHTAADADGPF